MFDATGGIVDVDWLCLWGGSATNDTDWGSHDSAYYPTLGPITYAVFDTDYDDICYFAENTYACSDYLASGAVACIGEAYYQPPSLPAGEPFVICGSGGAGVAVCPYPLPSGSVVRDIPAGALTYFEASADTYTGFNLPPGTWYVSETDGDFAKVWIACQASPVWVPTANIVG